MNRFKEFEKRIKITYNLIDKENNRLIKDAYNPIKGALGNTFNVVANILPSTPFNDAITLAEKRLFGAPSTKRDLRSIVESVMLASLQ